VIYTLDQSIQNQLRKGLDSGGRPAISRWHECEKFRVYLRAGPYHYDLASVSFLSAIGVSNIAVSPTWRRTGVFKAFIEALEKEGRALGYTVLRVEEVNSRTLRGWLERNGYVMPHPDLWGPVYVKVLSHE
jgi:GNAT superfamily N-acetyltransferase